MDKKIGRTTKSESVKDRGDLRKFYTNKETTETYTKELSERGDTHGSKINTVKKSIYVINDPKSSIKTSDKYDDTKREQPIRKKVTNKNEKIENQIKTYLDLEGRRRLRERYTLKLNSQKDLVKNEVKTDKCSDKDEKKSVGSLKSEKRKETTNRRPIIKTIAIKNDNRVYKAVTFVDRKNHTPIQIEMPSTSPKRKVSKSTETPFKYSPSTAVTITPFTALTSFMTVPTTSSMAIPSKVSIKEKTKREKKRKRILSPDIICRNQDLSPVTEVAKWAPSSLNEYTKPYYEAWVNTTLSAISRCTHAEKEKICQSLKANQVRRSELFQENFNDERYTGRIKINAKSMRIGRRKE